MLSVQLELAIGESQELTSELEEKEKDLQRQGGNYARNKGRLEERRRQINSRVETLESSLREHATGLLPIAFASNLLKQVIKQIEVEQDVRFGVVVDESLARAARLTLSGLRKIDVNVGQKTIKLGSLSHFKDIEKLVERTHTRKYGKVPTGHPFGSQLGVNFAVEFYAQRSFD